MKRALIVEGGGMRGAHSAGVLAELSKSNPPNFDVIIGSSAGACSVAFWVSEQYARLERIWGHYLHKDRFIRYRHLILPGAVMDLGYLIDEVFARREPLDTTKILASQQDFLITLTHCETGDSCYLRNKDGIDVLAVLKAAAAMPVVYPLPVWYQGEPYADGGISDSIPLQKAIDEGCEEFWLILTRPRGYRKKPMSRIPWPRWFYRQYPALAEALLTRHRAYNETIDLIETLERQGTAFVIRPSENMPVSRLTRKQGRILAAIRQGHQDARALLARI